MASTLSHPGTRIPYEGMTPGSSWKRLLSVVALIALVLAGSVSAWVVRDPRGDGGGSEELSYSSFVLEDGQEIEVAYDVPMAEDCTVEPLTVDQMMEKLSTRSVTQQEADIQATLDALGDSATPLPDLWPRRSTLQEETHAELVAAQREWLACSLFGSPLQRWALETNQRVQVEFRQRYLPVIDMALIEEDLTDLAAGKENRLSGPPLTDESALPMVPVYSKGFYNQQQGEDMADLTVFWVRPDGTPLLNFGKTEEDLEPYLSAPTLEQGLANTWTFHRSAETGQWQLDDMELRVG